MSALQVVDNDLVADRDKGLIHTVTAFASSLEQAQSRFPFVRARGSVAGFPGLLAYEPDRKDIGTPAKQGSEQLHLASRRVQRLVISRRR
jgi:hypothetical protein